MKVAIPVICGRFHQAVELIGGRWTGAIIQALLRGPTRYASIRAAIPDISDRMLSDRLRILESEGLVERQVFPETPVRVEYQLTEKGQSLDRALAAIGAWAEQWIPAPAGVALPEKPGLFDQSAPSAAELRPFVGKPRIKPKVAP
ncbi:MAG TPA: helix-turn-helix domain-containing protein [Thermoanaerobaculia bacterium]|nr:helix-turn-helix domain-containing protein [Thermoanaerobaculia bacterium]